MWLARVLEQLRDGLDRVPRHVLDLPDQLTVAGDVGRDPGEARAVGVHAVIAVLPAHEDLLVGLAQGRPVAPRELAGRVDRVGSSAGREEHGRVGHRGDRRDARPRAPRPVRSTARRTCGSRRSPASARRRASAISARPWPTLQYQSEAVPSRYSLPFESQMRQPCPRATRSSRSRVAPMLVKPRQKLVMREVSAFAPRRRAPWAVQAARGSARRLPRRTRRPRRASRRRAAPRRASRAWSGSR